ncbi:GSCOCG00000471001-RA-CDS [Cotesia congregata]|uniref:F-box domain-containing protein n=1 Tax=Cotesia congregata TaxID=51543 RepID=A0A8J2MPL4_COTCN|nr:GSCOCG00000471001-RA-CDS [Cotesia congregata]CAG5087915.1 Protein of unknown function [Cotesia congregata]
MSANKRRKISSSWEVRDGPRTRSRTFTLETLPPEVLEMVFKYLPCQVVATSARLVSRQCQLVATSVLNGAFISAGHRLEAAMLRTEARISQLKNETDVLAHSRAFNILELIRSQYKMLRAVTWRYTHPPRPEKFPRLCFYAGSLLDELNNLLYLANVRPAALIGPNGPDAVVTAFFALCKRFMNYFEKVSERKLNRSALVSGCKAIDILDCLAEGRRVVGFRLTTGRGNRGSILCMQLRYVMRRAWFTCLEVPRAVDETSWRDEQRFMHLRLRRLVGSVNEHHYEAVHHDRERLMHTKRMPLPRIPVSSTYSGYGEYGGQFFYYGNMNRSAFANKFHLAPESEDYEADDRQNSRGISKFDLTISVDLRCSPELAPFLVRSILKSDDFDHPRASHNPEIYMKMKVSCPGSVANRLPGNFIWEQKACKRSHSY